MDSAFCSYCGEQRLDAHNRSFKFLITEYIEQITSVDSKIFRTLRLLLFRPGELDYNYHNGARVNFLRPISLFLLVNFLFVFFSPITDFNVTLYDQLNLQVYSNWLMPLFQDYLLPKSGLEPSDFAAQYNQSVVILSRSTIIIQAVIFFLFVVLINQQKKYYSGDHLVFALNLHSWYMTWIVLLLVAVKLLVFILYQLGFQLKFSDWYFGLLPVGLGLYVLLATHRLYRKQWWLTLIRTVLLLLALKLSHVIYRLIQFFLVSAVVQ